MAVRRPEVSGFRRRLAIVLLAYGGMPLAVLGLTVTGHWTLALLYILFPLQFTMLIMAQQRAVCRRCQTSKGG
jgi:membrane protein implicated in regulation of membrane protease activity